MIYENKTKIAVTYADLVAACKECIDDVSNENNVNFDTNLNYFIEGLVEDINYLKNGEDCGMRPKTTEDTECFVEKSLNKSE